MKTLQGSLQQFDFAIIFDMDGVVVNNTKYHTLAWQEFLKKYGRTITLSDVKKKMLGRMNAEIFRSMFRNAFTKKEMTGLAHEKEAVYRKLYARTIHPLPGLPAFIRMLVKKRIKIALATAAPPENVRWVLRKTRLAKYFSVIIDDTGVKRGKPHPDIFLKCARRLHVSPSRCVVFEDGILGILAAKRAGMKVVGVATTHKLEELRHTDLAIRDFKRFTIKDLEALW